MIRIIAVLAVLLLAGARADACNVQSRGPDGCNYQIDQGMQRWHEEQKRAIARQREIERLRHEQWEEEERLRQERLRQRRGTSPTQNPPRPAPQPPGRTADIPASPPGDNEACEMFPHMCASWR